MKSSVSQCILIALIIAAITLPAVICYFLLVAPSDPSDLASASDAAQNISSEQNTSSTQSSGPIILIDPGHGGFDPGKVSPEGIKEKDINLAISLKLRDALNNLGFCAYLTRESDISLNSADSGSKKTSDLRNRTNMAEQLNADLYISIHQNSYSAEYVHGAQVFYYSTSPTGKSLAESIQQHIIDEADPDNTRMAKGNPDYMVLKDSPCTSVIVECGFLSNNNECQRLCDNEYQFKIANAIANAIDEWSK